MNQEECNIINIYVGRLPDTVSSDEYNISWNNLANDEKIISIADLIDKDEEEIRRLYVSFINELGNKKISKTKSISEFFQLRKGYNVWWMSLLVEKNLVKSPQISDCLKFIALEKVVKNLKPKQIRLVDADYAIQRTVSDLCNRSGINFIFESIEKAVLPNKQSVKKLVPAFFKGIVYILLSAIKYRGLTKLESENWKSSDQSVFLFSHFINLDLRYRNSGKVYSKYWGRLPKLLYQNGVSINVLNHFHFSKETPDTKTAVSWVADINSAPEGHSERHRFLYSFLNLRLILKILLHFFKIHIFHFGIRGIRKLFKPIHSNLNFWYLLRNDWIDSTRGTVLAENLILIALIDKAISSLPKQKLGLYLQENNGWERAFVHAWKRYQTVNLVGVPHTTIRFWDLRYVEDPRLFGNSNGVHMPRPDFTTANGPVALKMFENALYKKDEILKVEALRYLEAGETNTGNKSKITKNVLTDQKIKILLCGDIDLASTHDMLSCVEQVVPLLIEKKKEVEFVFKPHPVATINISKYSIPGLCETNENVKNLLIDFDVMIAVDSTSAGVEAYIAGLRVIVFRYAKRINFSPLKGVENVKFVNNAGSLLETLTTDLSFSNSSKNECFFYTDNSLPKWKKILKENGFINFN